MSDHFHPWNSQLGHSSSIWPVLGALSVSTSRALLVSAVTSPILRFQPTTLAQAASTVCQLSKGRFVFGLGTGEKLNEHIAGQGWPRFDERLERLEEFVLLLRDLLGGSEVTHRGKHFTVEKARLYDAPENLPLALAASGPRAARLAGQIGDALISLGADAEVVRDFETAGGQGKPRLTQLSVCWGRDRVQARREAHRLWPIVALEGKAFAQLSTPEDVERACQSITEEEVGAAIVCGPDPLEYRQAIDECLAAGFDGVALHQIGPDQGGFFSFWQRELKPHYAG